MNRENEKKGFILMFLGILSAFGPFVMDMYLPTLPAMADYFGTTSSGVRAGCRSAALWPVERPLWPPVSVAGGYGLVSAFYLGMPVLG